jgi:hypothetical protein
MAATTAPAAALSRIIGFVAARRRAYQPLIVKSPRNLLV